MREKESQVITLDICVAGESTQTQSIVMGVLQRNTPRNNPPSVDLYPVPKSTNQAIQIFGLHYILWPCVGWGWKKEKREITKEAFEYFTTAKGKKETTKDAFEYFTTEYISQLRVPFSEIPVCVCVLRMRLCVCDRERESECMWERESGRAGDRERVRVCV